MAEKIQILTQGQRDFLTRYVNQPAFRRDPVCAYQAAFPAITRVNTAYQRALEILDRPQAQQHIHTLTTGVDLEDDSLTPDEYAVNFALMKLKTVTSDTAQRQWTETYSRASRALSGGKAPKEEENSQSGALGPALASMRGGIGEELGKSE